MTWLDDQIEKIEATKSKFSNEIEIIKNINPTINNEFEERTPLKLIFLNYALHMYTIIIKKYFDNFFYAFYYSEDIFLLYFAFLLGQY